MKYRTASHSLVIALVVLATTVLTSWAVAQEKKADSKPPSATAESTQPEKPPANVDPNEYIIGTDDVLNVNVWKEPEMSRVVPVRPDGKITLPLIGDMMASGKTPHQLQTDLSKALSAYMSSADVTVSVQDVKSQKYNILGEVQRPGAYPLTAPTTILDAIAQAGGLRDFAKGKKIYLLRTTADGKQVKLPFNYNKVIKGEDLTQNVKLEPRDTIVVP